MALSPAARDGVEMGGGGYEKSQESGKILVQMKVFLNETALEPAGDRWWGWGSSSHPSASKLVTGELGRIQPLQTQNRRVAVAHRGCEGEAGRADGGWRGRGTPLPRKGTLLQRKCTW